MINGGNPGFDTHTQYERLKLIYDHYQPKYVIIGFSSGDIIENGVAYRDISKTASASEHKDSIITDNEIQNLVKKRERKFPALVILRSYVLFNSYAVRLFAFYYKTFLIKYIKMPGSIQTMQSGAGLSNNFDASEFFLDKMYHFLSERNSKMILLFNIPLFRFDASPSKNISDALKKYSESRNIYYVDPLDAMSKYNASSLYVAISDHHYNAKGNSITAEVLKDFFVANRLL